MSDIRRILCPVDFSDASQHAIEHAVLIAGWYGSSIAAFHVSTPAFPPMPELPVVGYAQTIASTLAEEQLWRRDIAACFSAAGWHAPVDIILGQGAPAPQILTQPASATVDLIVMGTHGHTGFEHLMLGSVTEKVLHKAPCPVLVVPPRATRTSRLPFKRILCPVDFSASSRAALDLAFSFAQEGDAELTILHVLESPDDDLPVAAFVVPEYRRQRERDALAALETLVPASTRDWCRPTTRLGDGKPYREILGIAAKDAADLIVMGVQGRNPLDVMLFGSTTNQVVRRATCPVLTLREPKGASAKAERTALQRRRL